MPIAVCTCNCGSVEQLARSFLNKVGYQDWLNIPIEQGKERSRRMLSHLPNFPEIEMLDNYIKDASKWVAIIGWNDQACRWADIAHNANKSRIDAELIVQTFAGVDENSNML